MTAPASLAAALSEAERRVLRVTIENTDTGCFWIKLENDKAARALEAKGLLKLVGSGDVARTKSDAVTPLGLEVYAELKKEAAA